MCDIGNESDPLYSSRTDIQSRLLSGEPVCWEEKSSQFLKTSSLFLFIRERISSAVLDTDRWVAAESGGRKSFPQVQSASVTYLFFNYQLWLSQCVISKSRHRDTPNSRKHKNAFSPITRVQKHLRQCCSHHQPFPQNTETTVTAD